MDTATTEKQWNVGGTLHASTIAEWHAANFDNGLATCADWVLAIDKMDSLTQRSVFNFRNEKGKVDAKKYLGYCLQLCTALTSGTKENIDKTGYLKMSEVAMVAAAQLGWIKSKEGAK